MTRKQRWIPDHGEEDIRLPRGVLKVKAGYNPNSSSIGTVVYSLPFAHVIGSAAIAVLAALVAGKRWNGRRNTNKGTDRKGEERT